VADLKAEVSGLEKENNDLKKRLKKFEERFDRFDAKAAKWLEALADHAGIDCENYVFKDEKQAENTDPRAMMGE